MALQIPIIPNAQCLSFRPLVARISSTNFPVGHSTSFGRSPRRPAIIRIRRCLPSDDHKEPFRPLANFTPDIWRHFFTNLPLDEERFKSDSVQTEILKEGVYKLLMASTDPVEKVNLINTLCRLGVSYHFEGEIEQQLRQIFDTQPQLLEENDYDLCTVALVFRVLRQNGYKVSCDVFNKFMDSDKKFKESLVSDLKGMLSLYETAHLSVPGEEILDEALAFTKTHLASLATQASSNRSRHINNALRHPLHKAVTRFEAKKFIDFYQSDESRNETIYKFAKYDYRRVWFLHLQELRDIAGWWEELNLGKVYTYSRVDRVMESYFWMLGLHFEPQYVHARIMSIKISMLVTIFDDTYDGFGTYEELQCLTEAIERWDYSALEQLPDYMKKLYKTMLDVFCECENFVTAEGRPYAIVYTREEVKKLLKAYQKQADWLKQGYVPTMEEYLNNEVFTGACYAMAAQSFLGMGEIAGIKAYEWVASDPKICRASSTIARLENDLGGYEAEQRRRHPPSSIQCYMKQYGVSKEEAIEGLREMIENCWKDMNEEYMRPSDMPRAIHILPINYARLCRALYINGDGNTEPEKLKEFVTEIIVEDMHI